MAAIGSWKDGSTFWENLKDMKEAYPIQVADCTISRGIQDHVAFRWWLPSTIEQKSKIIKAVKSKYVWQTHKYGIQLLKSMAEAYEINKEAGIDYWHQAMMKEMKNNMIAFRFLEE